MSQDVANPHSARNSELRVRVHAGESRDLQGCLVLEVVLVRHEVAGEVREQRLYPSAAAGAGQKTEDAHDVRVGALRFRCSSGKNTLSVARWSPNALASLSDRASLPGIAYERVDITSDIPVCLENELPKHLELAIRAPVIRTVPAPEEEEEGEEDKKSPLTRQNRQHRVVFHDYAFLDDVEVEGKNGSVSSLSISRQEEVGDSAVSRQVWSDDTHSTHPMTLVLVILNRPVDDESLLLKLWKRSRIVVAADGASNRLYKLNLERNLSLVPDAIVGDMDSSSNDVLQYFAEKGTQIVRVNDQESTDFEKALAWVASKMSNPTSPKFRITEPREEIQSVREVLREEYPDLEDGCVVIPRLTVACVGGFGGRLDQVMRSIRSIMVNSMEIPRMILFGEGNVAEVLAPNQHHVLRSSARFQCT